MGHLLDITTLRTGERQCHIPSRLRLGRRIQAAVCSHHDIESATDCRRRLLCFALWCGGVTSCRTATFTAKLRHPPGLGLYRRTFPRDGRCGPTAQHSHDALFSGRQPSPLSVPPYPPEFNQVGWLERLSCGGEPWCRRDDAKPGVERHCESEHGSVAQRPLLRSRAGETSPSGVLTTGMVPAYWSAPCNPVLTKTRPSGERRWSTGVAHSISLPSANIAFRASTIARSTGRPSAMAW